jgi:phenylacetic acid degradation operon negative regulatory protein
MPAVDDDLAAEFDRRHSEVAGSSARSLLLTVLGSVVLPNAAAAWTSSLLSALDSVGVEERAARQAISRSAAAGWLVKDKQGRRVRWRLTERAQKVLGEGAGRIYTFGERQRSWDHHWLLVFASIPEARRDLRYRLRVRLNWAGFGSLGWGIWVSPWTERESEALEVLESLGTDLGARSFVAAHGCIGDPGDLVRSAWELEHLAAAYRSFQQRHEHHEPATATEAMATTIALVHDWRRFPAMDPGLPPELLPPSWPGTAAARLFTEVHRRWYPVAQQRWLELEEDP